MGQAWWQKRQSNPSLGPDDGRPPTFDPVLAPPLMKMSFSLFLRFSGRDPEEVGGGVGGGEGGGGGDDDGENGVCGPGGG